MAMFNIALPQVLMPAYNPVKYITDSTNNNLIGFKYIYDIYESGTLNKIAEYRVMPMYLTGYGEVDLSKLLQAQVSYDLYITNTVAYHAANSYYKYDVHIGEEFNTGVAYTAALTNNAGNVRITVAHSFVVGDQVNIVQVNPLPNPNLEGLFTVVSVVAGVSFTVNSPFALVTNVNIDGSVTYADGRKTITRNILNNNNYYVFNGAIRWVEWPMYDFNNFMLNGFTDRLLTNLPTGIVAGDSFHATLSQDLWMNAVADGSPTAPDSMRFENDAGEDFEKNVTAGPFDYVSGISAGPNNHGVLSVLSGTLPLIKPTTEYYEFLYLRNGVPSSRKYRVYIDRRVRITEYSILFLDRMGSWGSFAFTGRAYTKGTVTREQFNKDVTGYVTGTQWTYNTTERGMTNTYIDTDTTIDLNTDYMNEQMAQYFTELISSPETYIKFSTYANDCDLPDSEQYVSCVITNNTFEEFKQRNKNLIKQSITVKLANNNIVNG